MKALVIIIVVMILGIYVSAFSIDLVTRASVFSIGVIERVQDTEAQRIHNSCRFSNGVEILGDYFHCTMLEKGHAP